MAYKNKDEQKEYNKTYRRTKVGIVSRIYSNQKYNSKLRHHKPPTYSRLELQEWCFNQPSFHVLFNNWVKSNYNKMLTPSVDRKDDYLGYFFGNIQLMAWGDNKAKYHRDAINGINNKRSKIVLQFDIQGSFIKEYYSISEAFREIKTTHISDCCRNKRKSAGGFIWKYKTI